MTQQGTVVLPASFFYIQYPVIVGQMVDDIASDIEKRAEYPPNIRRKGKSGELEINVSAVIQIVIQKLADDCKTITPTQWNDYREFYLDVRPKRGKTRRAGQKSISLSGAIEHQVAVVTEYLKANDIEMPYLERNAGGQSYPNKPLVVALALKHAYGQIQK